MNEHGPSAGDVAAPTMTCQEAAASVTGITRDRRP